MKGKVKFFNTGKGFGFITYDGGECFVHQSALAPGVSLSENDAVIFDVEQGDRGPKAVNVKLDTGDDSAAPADDAPAEAPDDDSDSDDATDADSEDDDVKE